MSRKRAPDKPFRVGKPYRLIVNDDGERGYWNWVAPLTAEQYLDAVFGTQVADRCLLQELLLTMP